MQFWFLTIFFFLILTGAEAQTVISGRTVDDLSKGVPRVSVTFKAQGGSVILGYTVSKDDGSYQLKISNSSLDSIELTFLHLSYIKKTVNIANKTSTILVKLEDNTKILDEIKIAAPPIFKSGDTINYTISEFASKQDRVIGDIIKKLPGIEMQGNMILYQGKPLQKYMVNNLDLMGGKYGLINNNLPAEAVKSVQIVENDQPIKVLNSLVFSDRASLNIQLKKFTTTGAGMIGVGYEPLMWDVSLTPMTFNKNFQMLNSFQTNNSGNDVASQLGTLTFGDGGGGLDISDPTRDRGRSYFSLAEVVSPSFDQKKWLDNRIFLYSSNLLKKLENGMEVKGNISYYNNLNKREGYSSTSIYTPGKTINYLEMINNGYKTNDLDAGLTITQNKKDIYIINTFKFNRRWNDDIGRLVLNSDLPIMQKNNFDDQGILNKFSLAKFIGKQLVSFNSLVDYGSAPQAFVISPGSFEDIFNAGKTYKELTQQIQSRSFKTRNSISLTHKTGKFVLSPEVGFNYQGNKLNTQILTDVQGSKTKLGDGYLNDLDTREASFYANLMTSYDISKWQFKASTPYSVNIYNVRQINDQLLDNEIRNTFRPSLFIKYALNSNTDVSVNGSFANQYGGLGNFNSSYILSSYRDIQRFDGKLQESKNLISGVSLSYRNTAKSRFANITYSYSNEKRDYVFRTAVDSNGLSTVELDHRNSGQFSHSLNARVSTYFSSIKTVFKANASFIISQADYLLNNLFIKQNGLNYWAGIELNNNGFKNLSFRYATNFNRSVNRLQGGQENTILTNNHYFEINFYPAEKHSISLNNSYYITNIKNQNNQLFLDIDYRWTIPKWKTDIEFNFINLLNNNSYIQQYNTEYSVIESYFQLRPRRFMISTKFKF